MHQLQEVRSSVLEPAQVKKDICERIGIFKMATKNQVKSEVKK